MLTHKQALRLRSIGQIASNAKTEVELANSLGISPVMALQIVKGIKDIVGVVPKIKRGRKPKSNEHRKQTAAA